MAAATIPFLNELAFIICAIIGGMMHYMKKVLRNETDATFFQWFGKANWMSTVYTFIMFLFVVIGALAGGIINAQTDFWAVLYTGFATGFAIDAGFNSDKNVTRELIDVRSDTQELLKRDQPEHAKPRVELEPEASAPKQEPKDEPKVDAPKRTVRRKAVEGSPKVPPKPIE